MTHQTTHFIMRLILAGIIIVLAVVIFMLVAEKTHAPSGPENPLVPTENGPMENPISLDAESVCLPHKNTEGPQTLECAFGVKADDGIYYALDTGTNKEFMMRASQTGTRLHIEGTMVPVIMLSSDFWQRYNIKGIIRVTELSKI